ncbi:hypothetical protein Ciccas_011332 [Cichlidogyrus casuarinus]|uniref:Uncharacterized protein n=1 Tax=Cichlidogyrus casuarinus TaxID=1844966 RepID=A0ABD2PTL1_9PLAT
MSKLQLKNYLIQRLNVAFIIACKCGHIELASTLKSLGATFSYETNLKRTALHIAAACNRYEVFTKLVKPGLEIDVTDQFGFTPLGIAEHFQHKGCARFLFLFRWKERAAKLKPKYLDVEMKEFQFFDSTLSSWLTGDHGQVYLSESLANKSESPHKSVPLDDMSDGSKSVEETHVKRGRGRPRKQTGPATKSSPVKENGIKRGRGRPKKVAKSPERESSPNVFAEKANYAESPKKKQRGRPKKIVPESNSSPVKCPTEENVSPVEEIQVDVGAKRRKLPATKSRKQEVPTKRSRELPVENGDKESSKSDQES